MRIYLSSADIMTRNQTRRVEIACPVNSPEIKNVLVEYLRCCLADNLKARRMMPGGDYERVTPGDNEPISVQAYSMDHPLVLAPTQAAKLANTTRRRRSRNCWRACSTRSPATSFATRLAVRPLCS